MRPDDLEKLICIMPHGEHHQFGKALYALLYIAFTDQEVTVREIIEQSTEINTPHSISRALSNSMFEQRRKIRPWFLCAGAVAAQHRLKSG